jgi:GTPase
MRLGGSLALPKRLHAFEPYRPSPADSFREVAFMFVDRVNIHCKAGDGGNGSASFRREAHTPRGGPDGGDGGDGGSVIIRAERNLGSLSNIQGHHHWTAENGGNGGGKLCTGRKGKDIEILVPPGTLIKDATTEEVIRDLAKNGESMVVSKGGFGGRGNKHFATATHRAPTEAENGRPGEECDLLLELKLIADVGIIGKPNAGKSTLLSRMTRATPEIANYPFTTKYPNLGVVVVGEDFSFVMADIPGLIEGAHAGIGLGHEFLRHVQRTKVLVHLVEPDPMDQTDPLQNYKQIREELRLYDEQLAERPELLFVSKSELPDAEALADLLREETGKDVMLLSAATGQGLTELIRQLTAVLKEAQLVEDEPTTEAAT